MESRRALGVPLVVQRPAAAAVDLNACANSRAAAADRRGDVTGAEDEDVKGVFLAGDNEAAFVGGVNALAIRVDQVDVGKIEGLEVFITEGWAFAPGLQSDEGCERGKDQKGDKP